MGKPILFNTEMIKAVLDGRKTQTRRVIKDLPEDFPNGIGSDVAIRKIGGFWCLPTSAGYKKSPYGGGGDRLWVRETFQHCLKYNYINYKADNSDICPCCGSWLGKWRPSIFMPRWASRITLRVTTVRVERVQEITEADALAEGVTIPPMSNRTSHSDYHTARMQFMGLWERINSKRGYSWDSDPRVWVVEFEVIKR